MPDELVSPANPIVPPVPPSTPLPPIVTVNGSRGIEAMALTPERPLPLRRSSRAP